ncbi:nitroreductase family protein [Parabacteroides sp. Marseille-P3160]|uniref:nitroreductase family protein n=1 Tax=Parabacteroides sp. Marseille-P3160 TaxID=1917887 RepID=UPI0009BC501F|nr:nitroreductase family protein [Parabacteroides sp. Marseille-P3160]
MGLSFKEAVEKRRTYYGISNASPVSDAEIQEIIEEAVKNVPSAFNSQSTRIVLLLGENHKKFWNITKEILRKILPTDAFGATENKIDGAFGAGYGTVLFYEDQEVVEGLQKTFALYSENFPVWSQHTSAMHQYVIWTALEEVGFGASLQHYNPLVDTEVAKAWDINPRWKLIAQLPFGTPTVQPGEKEIAPIEKRVLVYR